MFYLLPCTYSNWCFSPFRLMHIKARKDQKINVQGNQEIKNNVIGEKSIQLEDVQTTHM